MKKYTLELTRTQARRVLEALHNMAGMYGTLGEVEELYPLIEDIALGRKIAEDKDGELHLSEEKE